MHFHNKSLDIDNLFNSFTYKPHTHGHMFALLVMHVAAQTVVQDKSVYFLSDKEMVTLFEEKLTPRFKKLNNNLFKKYIDSFKSKAFFITAALGKTYRDVIKKLSNVDHYRDISHSRVVQFFAAFEDKVSYRQNGIENRTLGFTTNNTLTAFSIVDPHKKAEKYVHEYKIPEVELLRLKDRVVFLSNEAEEILRKIENDYEEIERQEQQKQREREAVERQKKQHLANWTETFTLKNGTQAVHRPDFVFWEGVQAPRFSLGSGMKFNSTTLTKPLHLDTIMTRAQFIAALRSAGLMD